MNVGILGLGLIGGSLTRAYAKAGHTVFATDIDKSILDFAQIAGAVSAELTAQTISNCNLILLSIYAEASACWLTEHAQYIKPETLVIDCCGIKEGICAKCFPLAQQYGFTFVGGHPMAGSNY